MQARMAPLALERRTESQPRDARMASTALRGVVEHDPALRAEVLALMGVGR